MDAKGQELGKFAPVYDELLLAAVQRAERHELWTKRCEIPLFVQEQLIFHTDEKGQTPPSDHAHARSHLQPPR
jgi:hypothetical protein